MTSWHGGGTGRVDELIQRVDAMSRGEGGRELIHCGGVLRVDELRSAITWQGVRAQCHNTAGREGTRGCALGEGGDRFWHGL